MIWSARLTDPTNSFYDADEAKDWMVIDLPALAVENDPMGRKPGEALWPERFGRDYLLSQQRSDARGFSALYQGRPSPAGGTFFLDDYLRTYKPNELPNELRIYASSDHAIAMGQDRDKTCLLVVGVDSKDNIWVLPDTVLRQVSSEQAVDEMVRIMRNRKPLIWWAEKTHISKSIGPFLRRRMREEKVNCAIHEVTPIGDKMARVQSAHARAAMGKVFFPERALWWPEARDQLLKFPQAAHDDFVDALAYIGLGLSVQVSAAAMNGIAPKSKGMTFGAILQESNRQRREAQMAKETRGW